jgi:arsenate reductase
MHQTKVIVFVCEHGAAKSILAAAYFDQLAHQRGLNLKAIARGTNPDSELSEPTVDGLSNDGLTPTESIPQKLSLSDVQSAGRIVSFCEIPKEYEELAIVERWDAVPAVSENYHKARDAILELLNRLFDRIDI